MRSRYCWAVGPVASLLLCSALCSALLSLLSSALCSSLLCSALLRALLGAPLLALLCSSTRASRRAFARSPLLFCALLGALLWSRTTTTSGAVAVEPAATPQLRRSTRLILGSTRPACGSPFYSTLLDSTRLDSLTRRDNSTRSRQSAAQLYSTCCLLRPWTPRHRARHSRVPRNPSSQTAI